MENKKEISEFRQDPVSKDWIIVSTKRSKRPNEYKTSFELGQETPIEFCPFEDPTKYGNEVVKSFFKKGENNWFVQVVKNKFPIVSGNECYIESHYGPYLVQTQASGYHEVLITRDHRKSLAQLSVEEVQIVIEAYRSRYFELEVKDCVKYILIFHNHGQDAGATVSHPHSQILAIPHIPADVRRSLEGAAKYNLERKRCVHCDVIEWELKEKKRIVFENNNFVVLVPYAPKFSYELRIMPKKHESYFEEDENTKDFAESLKISLEKIYKGLNNVAYNFFIHTPPADRNNEYDYYHWHLEINPRTSNWGGFELGTGGDIISVDPDDAAEYFRSIK
jgi:UDPglucose--hexose-1-phosphate uridylyltransferase